MAAEKQLLTGETSDWTKLSTTLVVLRWFDHAGSVSVVYLAYKCLVRAVKLNIQNGGRKTVKLA